MTPTRLTLPRTALAAALSLTTLLAACGGGGGGSAPVTSASQPTPAAPASTPAPAPALPTAAVLQQQAFDRLTQIQAAMGMNFNAAAEAYNGGPVGILPPLSLAVKNHLNYMLTNNVFTASENMSLPGATGVSTWDQALAAGMPQTGDTNGQQFAPVLPGMTGADWIDAVLSTGGGASFIMGGMSYGFAFAPWPQNSTAPKAMAGLVVNGMIPDDLYPATKPSASAFLYPYNGQTNVPPMNLVPDFPGSGTLPFFNAPAGSHGTPITFVDGGNAWVNIETAVLKDAAGNVVPTTIYGATLNSSYRPNGTTQPTTSVQTGVVLPNAPLKPETTYTLTYNVLVGQVIPADAFNAPNRYVGTLTFTTGNQRALNPNQLF